ncbi:MAG: DUF2062 domain-containing protein [Paludibacteraceae bacterium]|nr:DUF2062 domain-containing protein [Paludibacteraceae bacterium]
MCSDDKHVETHESVCNENDRACNESGWKQKIKKFFTSDFNIKDESNQKVAAAIAIGVLVGILPIWGFQMAVGVALAQFFGLNRLVVLATSNVSVPPMIVGVLYGSYQCGRIFFQDAPSISMDNISLDMMLESGMCYIVGAVIFAIISAAIVYIISFLLLHLLRRKTQQP